MSKNKSVEEVFAALYNCGVSDADAFIPVGRERIVKEALDQLYELLVSEAEPISDTEDAVTVSAINRLFGKDEK